jgi:DNA-binding transcriptional LysR family regulator
VIADLRAGHVDVVLAEADDPAVAARIGDDLDGAGRLRVALSVEDPFGVVLPDAWPVEDWRRAHRLIAELARRPWVAAPPGYGARRALERMAAAWGFAPRLTHVCIEFPSALGLVAAGLAAAVVPRLAWADAPEGTILLPDLPGPGSAEARRLLAITRPSRHAVPAVDEVVRAVAISALALGLPVDSS